ncbi:MAG: phospholipase [Deltaproteobacteria bacterium GWC2_56_8]|nr:MAG: phospholipase [Deltaproteobacteria bacterium GWB2_55_19]OGP35240.1 MAG: phospholipase [Deltaproteobacteria bacterium GWC2_56_8]
MRKLIFLAALMMAVVAGSVSADARSGSFESQFNVDVEVHFSPFGGATERIVAEINRATSEVLVQAYSFTSAPIAKALVNAGKRGVEVEVVLDKSQVKEKYSSADFLVNSGIRTFIDSAHAIAHNKIMVIDRKTIVTGSFNFTKAAEERNAENLLVINGSDGLVQEYLKNYVFHRNHSVPYSGRGGR